MPAAGKSGSDKGGEAVGFTSSADDLFDDFDQKVRTVHDDIETNTQDTRQAVERCLQAIQSASESSSESARALTAQLLELNHLSRSILSWLKTATWALLFIGVVLLAK